MFTYVNDYDPCRGEYSYLVNDNEAMATANRAFIDGNEEDPAHWRIKSIDYYPGELAVPYCFNDARVPSTQDISTATPADAVNPELPHPFRATFPRCARTRRTHPRLQRVLRPREHPPALHRRGLAHQLLRRPHLPRGELTMPRYTLAEHETLDHFVVAVAVTPKLETGAKQHMGVIFDDYAKADAPRRCDQRLACAQTDGVEPLYPNRAAHLTGFSSKCWIDGRRLYIPTATPDTAIKER